MQQITIYNSNHPDITPIRAGYANTFWGRFRGLMLHKPLQPDEGLLLVDSRESTLDAAIHMFFMRCDLAVIWLDRNQVVVDVQVARRNLPLYSPAAPAQYILEAHTDRFSDFKVGDRLTWNND